MPRTIDKTRLIALIQADVRRDVETMRQAAAASREAATHEEAKPENDKDTRAIEASYLAGAQGARVRDLEGIINCLTFLELPAFDDAEPISIGAIAHLEREGERTTYFLAPQGGGRRVDVDGVVIQVVTPQAPLGRALVGKEVGDEIEVRAEVVRRFEIVAVE